MKKEIIISSTSNENRIAITEDSKLCEYYIENPDKEKIIGDIYLGRIAKVIPGIKAAFIDLGLKQDAFLHFSDVSIHSDDFKSLLGGKDSEIDEEDDDDEDKNGNVPNNDVTLRSGKNELPNLEKDKNIVVQITKEPVGTKGVRVTSKVALPGRYMVLLPFDYKVNASKQIQNLREKRRLKSIIKRYKQEHKLDFGAIIRTVAEDEKESAIMEDLIQLLKSWKEIENKIKESKPPVIIYKDLSLTSSIIRDQFKSDVTKVITDSKKVYKEIITYLEKSSPVLAEKVELYKDSKSLFDVYSIDKEINKTLNKKIFLKSGGHIYIEHTEAMVVIDVNSGKYAKSKDQEQNSLKTNLEAAREIVRQIRLRDLGGIIVIDFIDVYEDKNKKKVYDELKKEFKKDHAKVTILPMSEFALIQITRQRMRQSLIHTLSETCFMCGGTGMLESSANIFTRIDRWLNRFKAERHRFPKSSLNLRVDPYLYKQLNNGLFSKKNKLILKYFIKINLFEDPTLSPQEFRFILSKTSEDITSYF